MTKQALIEKYRKELEESKERLNKLAKQPVNAEKEYLVKLARTNFYSIRHFIEDLERLD